MIYYLGYYDIDDAEGRSFSPAAKTMMDYVAYVLSSVENTEMISTSVVSKFGFQHKSTIKISDSLKVKKFYAVPNSLFFKLYSSVLYKIILIGYLFLKIKKNDTLVVYHSLALVSIVTILRKIKKFRLILEINEIYNDVEVSSKIDRERELKFFTIADGYIFACSELNDIINNERKKYCVISGSCFNYENLNAIKDDKKVHVVYAGTLAPQKGGAVAAAAAKYLPPCFVLHLLGFGSKKEINYIKELIDEINNDGYPHAKVEYNGVILGEEFNRFLQACDIGLSTQNPSAKFNSSSFPSKIFTYMSNNLKVVSIWTPVIANSDVGKYIKFYHNQTSEDLAKAIIECNENFDFCPVDVIKGLSKKNKKNVRDLITNV